MLIFGNKYIDSPLFIEVSSSEEIAKTSPKDIIVLSEFKEPYTLAKYCYENSITYAIKVESIKDSLFGVNFEASYLIASLDLAKIIQKIANEYLWDAKVLAKIKDDNSLEEVALESIDGVIYQNHIKRIN